MISSADTERLVTVQRKVGGEKQTVPAPEVVLNYNKGMDGVDRHDQYRMLFSLCSRHGFKKYPVKLILALFDIALTNAVLHFKLRWNESNNPYSKMSRVDFLQDIADKLINTNREWEVHDDEEGINAIFGGTPASCLVAMHSPEAAPPGCTIEALEKYSALLKKNKRKCQICEYERRGTGRYKNVLYCSSHGIRACGVSRPPRIDEGNDHLLLNKITGQPASDLSWILGDEGQLTCMEKYHQLYLPRNLFKAKQAYTRQDQTNTTTLRFARIIPSCDLYKTRQCALGIEMKQRPVKYNKEGVRKNDSETESDEVNRNIGRNDSPRRSQRAINNNRKKTSLELDNEDEEERKNGSSSDGSEWSNYNLEAV